MNTRKIEPRGSNEQEKTEARTLLEQKFFKVSRSSGFASIGEGEPLFIH